MGHAQTAALLAYLAEEPAQSKRQLSHILYPFESPQAAKRRLYNTLRALEHLDEDFETFTRRVLAQLKNVLEPKTLKRLLKIGAKKPIKAQLKHAGELLEKSPTPPVSPLSDEQWSHLLPLTHDGPQTQAGPAGHQQPLLQLVTGCSYQNLPRQAPYASSSTTHRWLQRWQTEGC